MPGRSVAMPVSPKLEQALLDFQAQPGRFRLALREPPALFGSVDEVLQVAIGHAGTSQGAQEAARFFVRSALLQPGANHYTLLGLQRAASPTELKKRYRLMMRLLHPDFSGPGAAWPDDAAVRVNLAYQTLSAPEPRRAYDAELGQAPQPAAAAPTATRPPRRVSRPARPDLRSRRVKLAICGSFAIGLLFMAFLFAGNDDGNATLVQRPVAAGRPASMQSAFNAVVQAAQSLSASVVPVRTTDALAPAAAPETAGPSIVPVRIRPEEPVTRNDVNTASDAAEPQAPPPAPAAPLPAVVGAPGASAALPAAALMPHGPTITDVHPTLSRLLQVIESGRGDELLLLVNAKGRGGADAVALAREFDELTRGTRPQVLNAQFKGEPRDGRLLVRGFIKLRVDDSTQASRDFGLLAEFVRQDGAVVLTRLAAAP